jgi:site-specific recombinase XerD
MTRFRLQFVHKFRDRHGKVRRYLRRPGCKAIPLPGLPGLTEFMAAYQSALVGPTTGQKQVGEERAVAGTVQALVAAYLDCSPAATSPFKNLAAETRRTRRNILESFREQHGDKRIYRTDHAGQRVPVLTRAHVQRMVNQKSGTPFGQRNFLNTLHAMFRWAVAEDRVPDDPTLGVTRLKIESSGYPTWSEENIAQYRRRHPPGKKMAQLALELLLTTAARRGDIVKLGPHMSMTAPSPSSSQRLKVVRQRPSSYRYIPTSVPPLRRCRPPKLSV